MKKLSFSYLFVFLGLSLFLVTSCGDNSTDTDTTGPSVDLLAGAGFINEASTVDPGATFSVQLQAFPGENDLQSVSFFEDGFDIPGSDITITDIPVVNNPQLVTGDGVNGITWDITLNAPATAGDYLYEFEVKDATQTASTASILITVAGSSEPFAVNFTGGSGGVFEAEPNSLIEIPLSIPTGGSTLNTIAVYEDGNLIGDLSRLRYKDIGTDFDNNPKTFEIDDLDGFEGSIYVKTIAGAHDLSFEVTTDAGDTATGELTYNAGTAIEEITGVLLNSAGPPGTGGLDLDTGNGNIGSTDAAAEIKDEGIDGGNVDANWLQQISGVNGSELRLPDTSVLPENFSFENVNTKEEVQGAFDTGLALSANTTGTISQGDIFVVKNGDNYYLLLTTEVNVKPNDNTDNYVFSIKK